MLKKIKMGSDRIKKELNRPVKDIFLSIFILLLIVIAPYLLFASTLSWTQTDWSGGDGQTAWSDATKFSSQTNIDTGTAGEFKLATTGGGGGGSTWAKTYGGIGDEDARTIQQTPDGGYIVLGNTTSFGAGGNDVWVTKINSANVITWQKTYGGLGDDYGNYIQQTSDGGYIVLGTTNSFGAGDTDVWILKIDSNGAIDCPTCWQKTYGGASQDYIHSIRQTTDGGYILAGETDSFGAGLTDAWILKLDSTGAVTWQNTYGEADSDYFYSIEQTPDGGYIVGGYSYSYGDGSYANTWILKLDSSGVISWQKIYGGDNYNDINFIKTTSEGGYIMAGQTALSPGGDIYPWVVNLDSSGNVLWQKTYSDGGIIGMVSIQQTPDGGYVALGSNGSVDPNYDVWVLKLDSGGAITWQKTYGGTGREEGFSIQETSDGGYVVAGTTNSFGSGDYDALILKVSSMGLIDSPCVIINDSTATADDLVSVPATVTTMVASSAITPIDTVVVPADSALLSSTICPAFAQNNWIGGGGQLNWSDITKFFTSTDVDYGTTNNLKLNIDLTPTSNWIKTYGELSGGSFVIKQTSDGGYVAVGSMTPISGSGNYDAWVLKLDSAGAVTWQKTYGGADLDWGNFIQQTSDGGYILAVDTSSFGAGNRDALILKLDSSGSVIWQKTYGGIGEDFIHSILQISGGGYIVAGSTDSSGAGGPDAWVLKLDSDGAVTWQKTYGGGSFDYANYVQQTSDGGYVVAGHTLSFGAGDYDAWVLKLDSAGAVTWQKTYGGVGADFVFSVQQTSDGGYITMGSTDSSGAGDYDAWVLKLASTGAVTWQKTYGGTGLDQFPDYGSIQQTSDGGYVVAGKTNSSGAGDYDAWVLKLASTGAVTWQKTYGGTGSDDIRSIQQTSDGGYVAAGLADSSFAVGGSQAWVLKLDSDGLSDISCTMVADSTVTPADSTVTPADATTAIASVCPVPPYLPLGTLISSIFDAGSSVTWGPFSYLGTEPVGTSFDFWVSIDGGAIWTAVTDFVSQTFGSSQTVSYKVQLNTTDTSATPTLTNVSLSMPTGGSSGYVSSGTLTSSIYDSGDSKTTWGPLNVTVTTPASTTSLVEVSTDDGGTWNAVTDFVSQTFGPSQTFEYRVTLDTSDSAVTPTVSDISIPYEIASGGGSGGTINPPPPTCTPRPACLDAYPRPCMIAEPIGGWCPPTIPTCVSPQVLVNNICVTPSPTCTPTQVLKNGVCVEKTPPPCRPRPACLDATPRPCTIAEPIEGWCPTTPPGDGGDGEGEGGGDGDGGTIIPPTTDTSSGGKDFSSFLTGISLDSVFSGTRTFTNDPVVKIVKDIAIAIPAVTSLVALSAGLASGLPLQNYLFYLLITAFQFLGFVKKAKPWGTVYDAYTKRPLPYARVEILNEQARKLQSTIADANGRYSFLVSGNMSNVALRAYLTKYDFPSKEEPSVIERKIYPNIYQGGFVNPTSGLTNYDLPMDPRGKSLVRNFYFGISSVGVNNFLAKTANVLFALGLILGLVNVFVDPGIMSFLILGVILLTFLLRNSGFKLKPFGLTKNAETNKPLPFGLVALHNQGGERISFTVSDDIGRYFLLTEKGNYLLKAFTPSFISPARTKEILISTHRGWISREVKV